MSDEEDIRDMLRAAWPQATGYEIEGDAHRGSYRRILAWANARRDAAVADRDATITDLVDARHDYRKQVDARDAEIAQLRDVLLRARIQIEYMHKKFTETATGFATISCIDDALKRADNA